MTTFANDSLFAEQLGALERSWIASPDKPEESAEGSLRALWFTAAGTPSSVVAAVGCALPELDDRAALLLRALVGQRVAGAPLAHLTERQRFMGLEMLSGPGALIPRRETELLAGAAIEKVADVVAARGHAMVLDMCTGSGNVALSIAAREPAARVFGADLSEEALALARRNAAHLGISHRLRFQAGDLFAPFETDEFYGQVDVITCNPPYISSSKVPKMAKEISEYEPRLAFDGGAFGVDVLFRLISNTPRFVRSSGWLCVEVGLGQGPLLVRRLERHGAYTAIQTLADAHGEIRALVARVRAD